MKTSFSAASVLLSKMGIPWIFRMAISDGKMYIHSQFVKSISQF